MTGRGPEGYARSTDRIEEDIHERLTRHGEIDASRIRISLENGEVTLEGTVRSRREKRMAEDTAEGVQGVRDVHNRLRVEERSGQGEGEAQEAGGQREGRSLAASGSGTGEAGAQGGRGRQKKAQASSRAGGSRSTKRSAGDQASQPGDAGQGEGGAAGEQTP